MNLYLDGVSALERIKLSAMLSSEIGALTDASVIQRVQIAGRIASIMEQLGEGAPTEFEPIVLTGKELGEFPDTKEGMKARRDVAFNHYKENIIPMGGVYCHALNSKVLFNMEGAKKVKMFGGDPRKVKMVAAIPEIIAVGRKTSESDPTEKAASKGVLKCFFLKAEVNLEGELIRARLVVHLKKDGTYSYDHSVDRDEVVQAMGGSSGALDSVVSTVNSRSVLLSSGAPLEHGLHSRGQMIGDDGDASNLLDSVDVELFNLFLDDEEVAAPAAPLKNFGWDRVKLADYSFEQLRELRHQVEAEHANPRDENGRYLENGQQTINLYDKKGSWKLDQLAWAVTYKLQEAKRNPQPSAPALTTKGNPLIDESVLMDLGLIREVAGRWKYRYDVSAPELFASTKEGAIEQGSDAYAKADPSQLLTKDQRWEKSNADFYADLDARYGKMSIDQVRKIMEDARPDQASTLAAHARESNNNGGRRTGPAVATQGAREGAELARQLERYLAERQAKESAGQVTPNTTGRAPAGGVVGMNGEHYKGGTFLPNTTLPKQGRAPGGTGGSRGFLIEPGVWGDAPGEGYKSIFNSFNQFIHVNDGVASVYERPDAAIEHYVNPDVAEGRAFLRAAAEAYNNGMRWFKPADIVVGDEHRVEPEHQIIEHVTKGGKGKTLRGIVRTDLSYAEAKAIDEYTFRKDGGYFIREKHLAGGTGIGDKLKDLAARRNPEDPEAEMRRLEAAAQALADRLANEQLREHEKVQRQVTKLRDLAATSLERAEAELGRDRLANTSRRANMAASGIARAEQDRAIALTMNNLADAIERGQAQHLAGITSRADVETLAERLRGSRANYEKAKGMSYTESQQRRNDPLTAEEARYASFPVAKWDSAGASRARILEMIKGKRGAPAIANEIRYAQNITRDQVLALRNILGQKELESQLGWWNVEQMAKAERLRRAGIENDAQLHDALGEFMEYKAGARAEDPIAKAERAIIGQKVGVDFFPTPSGEAKTMADLAQIKPGDNVLEPSAGNGNLADAAKAAGANVDTIEISSQLRDILTAKGYNVAAHDFMSYAPAKPYDAIMMNPPWGNRADADHIMRAYTMLKPGGRLVALAGEGVFNGTDAKAVAFREWLDEHGAEVEKLSGGTFKDKNLLATTGANGRRIVMTR